MKKDNIQKYLNNYSEKDFLYLPEINDYWEKIIAIPCHNEFFELKELLTESLTILAKKHKILLILIVNASESSSEKVHETNYKLLRYLEDYSSDFKACEPISLAKFINYDILLLNHAVPAYLFSERCGVGMARKTACDMALYLIRNKRIKSEWIRCTDADVLLPENYLDFEPPPERYSAINYNFYHVNIPDNEQGLALQLYEIYLRYYHLGLAWADSPYAFHTIGSTMAVSAESYAQVRGFPKKREAAEDFYMLNKLAKVNNIYKAVDSVIRIKGRESDRVPFGTGASMAKIGKLLYSGNEYKIYDPQVFSVLKNIYLLIEKFLETADFDSFIKNLDSRERADFDLMENFQFSLILKNSLNLSESREIIRKHIHTWFDAFRIIKLIHFISNHYYPHLIWRESLQNANFIDFETANQSPEEIRNAIFITEKKIL